MRAPARILLEFLCTALALQGCAAAVRVAKQEYLTVRSAVATSEIEISLHDSFIEACKDRATIDAMLTVDKADKRPHPAFLDGDLHIAGRAPRIGLPVVAEIKNAAFEREAVDRIHGIEGTGRPIRLAGAWRLWPEHVGSAEEVQGRELSAIERDNPDHVFEIHPVTRVDDTIILDSFRPVKGYSPGTADVVFRSFEKIPCRIIPGGGRTAIVTRKGQHNDVEFLMEIGDGRQRVVADGRFVNAAVLDLKGHRIVPKVRMVFVKDTPPEKMVRRLGRGDRLHVFGLPRIDLAAVAYRTRHSGDHPELLSPSLPYEIVVVGVYGDPIPANSRNPRKRDDPAGHSPRACPPRPEGDAPRGSAHPGVLPQPLGDGAHAVVRSHGVVAGR